MLSRRSTCGTSSAKRTCQRPAARSYFSASPSASKSVSSSASARLADKVQLGRCRKCLSDVSAIEGSAEPHVGRALSRIRTDVLIRIKPSGSLPIPHEGRGKLSPLPSQDSPMSRMSLSSAPRPLPTLLWGLPPERRATTARRSLRGERRPLSRAVGTGEFYVSFAREQRLYMRRAWRRRGRCHAPRAPAKRT